MVSLPTMEDGEAKIEKQQPFNPLHITSNLPQTSSSAKKYSLSSHVDHSRRSQSVFSTATFRSIASSTKQPSNLSPPPAHSPSANRRLATTIPGEFEFLSLWEEHKLQNVEQQQSPAASTSSSPSLHMQELLSQLASGISAMTTAFAQVQASLNTYDIVGHDSTSDIERGMVVREFQRLLDLDIGLHSLVQEYDMEEGKKSENKCRICKGATIDVIIEKKNGMLKSYEGIITRFVDEIVRKDALTHVLKETLAKCLLREDKLERQVLALEMNSKRSPAPT